jgi:hypothetical protein
MSVVANASIRRPICQKVSTARKEASGTGNMKFSMSGALTIGTLDGANIEIKEEVGADNFFLFGFTAQQVSELKAQGYRPIDYYRGNDALREVVDLLSAGFFSRGDPHLFRPFVDGLLNRDTYVLRQRPAGEAGADPPAVIGRGQGRIPSMKRYRVRESPIWSKRHPPH